MENQYLVLIGRKIKSNTFQKLLEIANSSQENMKEHKEDCNTCELKSRCIFIEYIVSKSKGKLFRESFVDELETIISTPIKYSNLKDAEQDVNKNFLNYFEVVILVSLFRKKAYIYKGTNIQELKKILLPKFLSIYSAFYLEEIPQLRSFEDISEYLDILDEEL